MRFKTQNSQIVFRCTADLKSRIETVAARNRLQLSEFVRSTLSLHLSEAGTREGS